MNNHDEEKKSIPESRIALIAGFILLGALILYVLNMTLPKPEVIAEKPTKTPSATPITNKSGEVLPIDCYLPDIRGNSALIVSSGGKALLIDAGYPEDAPAVIENIRSLGIEKLDLVFLTSAAEYALGGMADVLSDIPADSFYISYYVAQNRAVSPLIAALEGREVPVHAVKADFVSTVDWAENTELRILSPYDANYGTDADNALVLRLKYGSSAVLFLGNAGALAERMMVKALPNRLLHTDTIFLTDTGRTDAPYEKFFKVTKADRYYLKTFTANENASSATVLRRFLESRKPELIDQKGSLHLVLDGAEVKGIE